MTDHKGYTLYADSISSTLQTNVDNDIDKLAWSSKRSTKDTVYHKRYKSLPASIQKLGKTVCKLTNATQMNYCRIIHIDKDTEIEPVLISDMGCKHMYVVCTSHTCNIMFSKLGKGSMVIMNPGDCITVNNPYMSKYSYGIIKTSTLYNKSWDKIRKPDNYVSNIYIFCKVDES